MFNVKVIGADGTMNGGTVDAPVLVNKLQVTTVPARLFSVTLFNTGPDQYVQIHDSAATPTAGAVPKMQIKMFGDSQAGFDYPDGRIFKNGIFIGNSSTSGTYTAGSADCLVDATFRKSS